MKTIIFTKDWQGYKEGDELTTRELTADKIIKEGVAIIKKSKSEPKKEFNKKGLLDKFIK